MHLKSILDAMKNPVKIIEQARNAVKYGGKDATVIINQEGKTVTLFGKARGPQIWNESGIIK